jgi:hypothetical protein
MVDGYFNLVYFVVFCMIAYLWRPTDNNERYGLEQLAQDENELEDIERKGASLDVVQRGGGSLEDDEDDELTREENADSVIAWAEKNILQSEQELEREEFRALADEEEVETLVKK